MQVLGKILQWFAVGATVGATFSTYFIVTHSEEYEEHVYELTGSPSIWRQKFIIKTFAWEFIRVFTYPVTTSFIAVADLSVHNRLDRNRQFRELDKLYDIHH